MDNCSSHLRNQDKDFESAVRSSGLNIIIRKQPPKSPDLNVLDLGYFNSIQEFQQKKNMVHIPSLVEEVKTSYEELTCDKLSRIFLTWKLVMLKIIEDKGYNTYLLPHKKNALLESEGFIKTTVVIGDELM